jgi:hypothetical protein
MHEEVLKRFFEGEVSAEKLARDIRGSVTHFDQVRSSVHIVDMASEYQVTRRAPILLCDSVLSGALSPELLATIGFALEASDKFLWDGDEHELAADVIADWSCPEVNYPLTVENIRRFKQWLTDAEPYPARPTGQLSGGTIVSVVESSRGRRRKRQG